MSTRKTGDVMLTLMKAVACMEFVVECGRLLLLSISASYVGANVRRLAVKHGWDVHLLWLVYFFGAAQRGPAADADGKGGKEGR